MWEQTLADLRFEVEHRQLSGDGGATLRVFDRRGAGRELLRFDCFDRGPHYHVDPGGRGDVTRLDADTDTVGWTIAELGRDWPSALAKTGFDGACTGPIAGLLRSVEGAMRNPPADLDAVDPAALRRRGDAKWSHYPDPILPAWVAEMDYPIAEPIRRVLHRAATRSSLGYPLDASQTGLPEAFAERMAERFGWELDPRGVEILTDVVQGIFVSLMAYALPGQGAVVQTPIYPPFLQAVEQTGRALVENRLVRSDSGHVIDFDALRRAAGVETRVFMLCNPHNPSGRVFTRAELESVAALADERDWVVVADEIHADLVYPGREHIPFATLGPEVAARTVTLTSATKAFNIPGLRCAVAHFGTRDLKRRFGAAASPGVRGGVGLLGIDATITAWRHCQPWLDQVKVYLEANRDFVVRFVAERLPGVVVHPPEATYLAWLDCSALELPRSASYFFLKRADVALSDGTTFAADAGGHARLNFATSRAILTQILERMAAAV